MARTTVAFPDEPSRLAMMLASGIVTFVVLAVPPGYKWPIRRVVRLASPLLVKPVAIVLTRMGV
jgi:hypothetical protein